MQTSDKTQRQAIINQFGRSVTKRFPTFCGIRAVGSLTSQEMQEANRKRHAEALRVRAVKKRGK